MSESINAMALDLRSWLDEVRALGLLRTLKGADPHLEIGALCEIACEEFPERPTLLFEEIKGYDADARLVANLLNSIQRLALTVGLDPAIRPIDFVKTWRQRIGHLEPIAPQWVSDGPVLENVWTGLDVDVTCFPAPHWHHEDGGRYLGTADLVITRDPDNGLVNLGTYRVMVHDPRTLGIFIARGKHGDIHRDKYYERGLSCPVAISLGQHPLLQMAAAIELPYETEEYAFVGGIARQPVEVLAGPITGLPIPACAEVVIEGEMHVGEAAVEGPFGEFTGYYAAGASPQAVVHVRSVLSRKQPIVCGAPPLRPSLGSYYHQGLLRSALIWDQMERAGVPDVQAVRCHEGVGGRGLIVVAVRQRYAGHAVQAATVASQCAAGVSMNRYVVVVDEDIDVFDMDEVLWAMCTRSDPERSVQLLQRCRSNPLDPAIHPENGQFNSRLLIDACRPYERLSRFPKVVRVEANYRADVLSRWRDALFQQPGLSISE